MKKLFPVAILAFTLAACNEAPTVTSVPTADACYTRDQVITEIRANHDVPVSITGSLATALLAALGATGDDADVVDELITVKVQEPGSDPSDIIVGIKDNCMVGRGEMDDQEFQALLERIQP
jgi:hypothetical protein